MNTDSLINIITEEVLKRIAILGSQTPQNFKKDSKSILILDSISNQHKNNYHGIIEKWNNTKFLDNYCKKDGVDIFDYIIVPKLSNRDLVSIAIGNYRNEASEIIIDGLLSGKKVIVFEDGICYRKFKNTANPNFFNMFKEYEERIISFGIEIVRKENILEYLENETLKEIKNEPKDIKKNLKEAINIEEFILNKKVISEKDIQRLWNKGYSTISINKKSILTPLAMDFIRTNEIKINL